MRPLLKVLRDLGATRGRVAFMVLALAAGLTSMGTVLTMSGVLPGEMSRNYMDTVPASFSFDIGGQGVSDRLMTELRERPEVRLAERRATLTARWRRPGTARWSRALLFVVEDFTHQELALVEHEGGASVPRVGEVLVERSALGVVGAGVGEGVELTTAANAVVELAIVGVVHEPALAPAATEQAGYFYASPGTLALLGEPQTLNELRVLVEHEPLDVTSVEAQATSLAAWLSSRGVEIHEAKVPPPGRHPHQAPSEAVLLLLSLFAGLTVLLAAILSASLLATTMARQVREIGVMKTLGADRRQIVRIYVVMMGVVAGAAVLLSVAPIMAASRLGIDAVASMLNIDIAHHAVPPWVWALLTLTGLALPLLAAAPAIARASRTSVMAALGDHGARVPSPRLARWLTLANDRVLQAALRNALRVPKRFALTLTLLAVGGGLFVCAVSVGDAWEAMTEEVFRTRHYDVELRLAEEVDEPTLALLDDEAVVEAWGFAPATPATSGLPFSRTYPDGGHGSFTLIGVPRDTRLVDFTLRSGRWLEPEDVNSVVLNQLAASRVGDDTLGRMVELVVEGRTTAWRVVGVVEEVASPAAAYVSTRGFALTGQRVRGLRVATRADTDVAVAHAVEALEARLGAEHVGVVSTLPLELLFNAMGEHVLLLIRCLLGLAFLMALVSALALSSTMSTSVVERTRELGVLRATGATPRQVRRLVLYESLFVTLSSLPLTLLLALPLATGIGRLIGWLSFQLPLPLDFSWQAMAGWSLGSLFVASLASLAPGHAATRPTVREALARV